jgi:phenylacetate-coenzyme A ligase PaaK-like adenylate-forming protein
VIGKVVRALARSTGSADPFSVDFDPRWAKKLPPDSMALFRYLEHVVEQAIGVIEQQPIEVVFTTPAVLSRLAKSMTEVQRSAVRGVHYGGMALANADLAQFQRATFPNAVHLSGYGNTLFGCCMEISAALNRELDYYPFGDRLLFEVIDGQGQSLESGSTGQVCFTRLDQSMLIVRMRERDLAVLLPPPVDAPSGFRHCGVRNPHSPQSLAPNQRPGLY